MIDSALSRLKVLGVLLCVASLHGCSLLPFQQKEEKPEEKPADLAACFEKQVEQAKQKGDINIIDLESCKQADKQKAEKKDAAADQKKPAEKKAGAANPQQPTAQDLDLSKAVPLPGSETAQETKKPPSEEAEPLLRDKNGNIRLPTFRDVVGSSRFTPDGGVSLQRIAYRGWRSLYSPARFWGHGDYWQRIVAGFQLDDNLEQVDVQQELARYLRHPRTITRVSRRAGAFLPMITDAVASHDMPMEVALLPFVESGFDPSARSEADALGLWQFMAPTASQYGLVQNEDYDGRLDARASTWAALDYLGDLHKAFDHDWLLALAAYNAGEGRVRKAIKRNLALDLPSDVWSLELPEETRTYVARLLAYREIIRNINHPYEHNVI